MGAIPLVAYVTLTGLALGLIAAVGGVFVSVWAVVRIGVLRRLPIPLWANRAETRYLLASVAAAICASAWLMLAPAYVSYDCPSVPVELSAIVPPPVDGAPGLSQPMDEANGTLSTVSTFQPARGGNCAEQSRSFYDVNGPGALPLFTVPIAIALMPFAFYGVRIRPLVEGLAACGLGAQLAMGMSLYGAMFGPSGVLMLLAAFAALRSCGGQAAVGAGQ